MARLNIKIDDNLKDRGKRLFESMGMPLSTAIKVFIEQALTDGGFPFKPTVNKGDVSPVRYYVKTAHGKQNLDKYSVTHPTVSNNQLARMVLDVPSNVAMLNKWAKAQVSTDELEYMLGKKFFDHMDEWVRRYYVEHLPDLNKNAFDKKKLTSFMSKETIQILRDGHENQNDLLDADENIRPTEIKCLLIDYLAAKSLKVTDATLSVVFLFLNK